MPTLKSPRKGSLQFWPRKRGSKFLPRVNWDAIDSGKNLKGFICYKAGMVSVLVKDNTQNSMTAGKEIVVPATVLECPSMKIFSVRFYKNDKVMSEVLAEGLDKELKRRVKIPKKSSKKVDDVKDYDDVKLICYSVVKKAGIKKKPDMVEVGLNGSVEEKMAFVKENLGKEISVGNVFGAGDVIDVRGLTRGKGFQGPVKRFGIKLRVHKSEKGVRKVGSIAPWHPARVTFRTPMAGQMGMHTRVVYNNKILEIGEGKFKGIKNYGDVKTNYVLVKGSVQGPAKRQLVLTSALRETKKTKKKNYEVVEVLR